VSPDFNDDFTPPLVAYYYVVKSSLKSGDTFWNLINKK